MEFQQNTFSSIADLRLQAKQLPVFSKPKSKKKEKEKRSEFLQIIHERLKGLASVTLSFNLEQMCEVSTK